MSLNKDVEQAKVIEYLSAALASSQLLRRDLLEYLIDLALTEARTAFDPPKVVLVRKGQPRERLL